MLGPAWVSAFQEVPLAVSAGTRRAPRVPGPADAPRTPGRLLGAGGTPPARAPGHPRGAGVNSRAGPASAYLAVAQRRGRGHGAQGASGSGGLPGGVRRQRSAARSLAGGARPARRQRPRRLRGGGSEGAAPSSGGRREAGGERRVGRSGACGRPHRPSPRLPPTPSPAPRGVVPAGDPLGRQGSPGTRSFAKPLPPTRKPQRAQRGYLRSPAQEPACATPPEPRGPSPLAPPRGLRSSPAVPLLHPSSALSRKPPARAAPARFNGTLATCLRVGSRALSQRSVRACPYFKC